MSKKYILTFFLTVFLAIIAVGMYWQNPLILTLLICAIALFKHNRTPIKKELLMFTITGFVGSVGESIVMIKGPWAYASADFANFPIWLPFLWGLAGISGITLYLGLTNEK